MHLVSYMFASASLAWINWNSDPETQKGMETLNLNSGVCVHSQADRRQPTGAWLMEEALFQRQCWVPRVTGPWRLGVEALGERHTGKVIA